MNALVRVAPRARTDFREDFAAIAGHLVWKLETSAATIQGLKGQVTALRQDNLNLQQRGEDQDQLIDNLERDNTQLRGQLNQLAARIDASLQQNQKLQSEIKEAHSKIHTLERQVNTLEAEEGDLSKAFQAIMRQIGGAVREIFGVAAPQKSARQQLDSLARS